jgi:hypothetical protein
MLALLLALACSKTPDKAGPDTAVPVDANDADGDGWTLEEGDCDDGDPDVAPSEVELCDGRDQDCDGEIDEGVRQTYYADADRDGYGDPAAPTEACERPADTVQVATDCDDGDAGVYPGATEACDGVDNDCSGAADEGLLRTWWADLDMDGFGDAAEAVTGCAQPAGTTDNDEDCDDARAEANPLEAEVCDEVDNDCDGEVDEDVTSTFWADLDGDGYGDAAIPQDACVRPTGYSAWDTDCADADANVFPGAAETCNLLDDDCDGAIDEGAAAAPTWYTDADADGHGAAGTGIAACEAPAGTVALSDDCDDAAASAYPGGTETCDGLDNDCDGTRDEPDATDAGSWYGDGDGDGYGVGLAVRACSAPAGSVATAGDCDDAFASRYPGASEFCNDADDDCDGSVDEDLATSTWYRDADGDAFGAASSGSTTDCAAPSGYVATGSDCDDTTTSVSPSAFETCNDIDDDCDGTADDGLATTTWYRDADGDGYGSTSVTTTDCSAPSGYVATGGDCDDGRAATYPGAPETCNGRDDDCDGSADEGVIGSSASCPATDCAEILSLNPSASSGTYVLTRGSYACDMSTDGGGWTRVRDNHPVYGTTWDSAAANSEGFTWDEVWFQYDSGSNHGHCTFPGDIASCNNNGFRFGGEAWGLPARWGSSTCGLSTRSYESATRYLTGANWIVARSSSTDTIQLGNLEGISSCTTSDNYGVAYVDIWVRR